MENFSSKIKILASFWNILQKGSSGFRSAAVASFEQKLAEFLGIKYVIGVASGMDALILSLKAFDIGSGDEIIIPSVSAFATAAAVRWVNATPVFVDVGVDDMNIDPFLIERAITLKTKAIIPVHLNGKMAEMELILQIAIRQRRSKSLIVIEDAAQAIGSRYKDKSIGRYGEVACLSFNPHKILGTYDGGAVVTNRRDIAEKIFLMRNYGARPHEIHLNHPVVGTSSRLSPLHAAILLEKLPRLSEMIARSRENYFLYSKLLADINGLAIPPPLSGDYFINGHRFFAYTRKRDQLLDLLKRQYKGIRTDHTVPLPYFPALAGNRYKLGNFPAAEKIAREAIFLPTHYPLSPKMAEDISRTISGFFQEQG